MTENRDPLYCSFCAKSQHEIAMLIAGPTVFICDECVDLCAAMVRQDRAQRDRSQSYWGA